MLLLQSIIPAFCRLFYCLTVACQWSQVLQIVQKAVTLQFDFYDKGTDTIIAIL